MLAKIWRRTGAEVSLALLFQAATAALSVVGDLEVLFRIVMLVFGAQLADGA